MRNRFDQELSALNNELIEMGALIERAIDDASRALLEKDPALARQAIGQGARVDEKEKQIERRCLRLLLQQQPVAADLRMISTALKMITDMERIGDQAEDISEIALRLIDDGCAGSLEHIPQMAWATVRMVTGAVDAFVARDLDRARAVIAWRRHRRRPLQPGAGRYRPPHPGGRRGRGRGDRPCDGRQILRADRRPRDQHRRVGGLFDHRRTRQRAGHLTRKRRGLEWPRGSIWWRTTRASASWCSTRWRAQRL